MSGAGVGRGGLRGGAGLRLGRTENAEQGEREERRAEQTAAGFAGCILQCHFHADVSVTSRWPRG
ncbi:hypothetical protein D3C85_1500590 [compost metagenome]